MSFNYAISDSANLRIQENATGNVVLYTSFANQTTAEFSSEQVYAHAKGSRAVRFDHNKQGQLVTEFECFDLRWISILLGGQWTKGVTTIGQTDYLEANASNEIELTADPKNSSLAIFKLKEDGLGHDEEDEQTLGDPATEEGEYSITGTTVLLNDVTAPEGTKFVAYYLKDSEATAEAISIKADQHPLSYTVIGDTMLARKDNGVIEYMQFTCKNARPLGNLTINMAEGEVTTVSATFDLMPDASNDMMTLVKL